MEWVDCIVVGAGVVGLAVARSLAATGREVIVVESARGIGSGISSRNSEVIHAGIYYLPGSLKARLCVEGRNALYGYCDKHGVAHKRVGKLIVATRSEEEGRLIELMRRGEANGVHDLELLARPEVMAIEPDLSAYAAVYSPSTGIVDSHAFMLALQGELEANGGVIAFAAPFEAAAPSAAGMQVSVGGEAAMNLECGLLVNSAGLDAPYVASKIAGLRSEFVPKQRLAKGNYFSCARKVPFQHLIYPVPEPGGLGTHLTLDLAGQARFGPDVEWIANRSYAVNPDRKAAMLDSVRRYWPDIGENDLVPDYAGIRPKIEHVGSTAPDFVIQDESSHGLRGLVNLFGIESPGLTSSLAIAELVVATCAA